MGGMDIIDPTLAASASSIALNKGEEPNLQPLFWQIIGVIAILFVIWIAYSGYSSRLDTKPEEIIDVNSGLQSSGEADGSRELPISETL